MRYKAIEGSQLGHGCCFDATVIDTDKPVMLGGKHYDNQYDVVCECVDMETAKKIAAALNAG